MILIRIDAANGVSTRTRHRLLREPASLLAEITGSMIDGVRSEVRELPAGGCSVGGLTIAEAGVQAPSISVALVAGRTADDHRAIIERVSTLVADIVGVPIERVLLRIDEIPPHLWGIGGRTADSSAD